MVEAGGGKISLTGVEEEEGECRPALEKYGLLRHSLDDWRALTAAKEDQVARTFALAECTLAEGAAVQKNVRDKTHALQTSSSQFLVQRSEQTLYWVHELERSIHEIREEAEKLEHLRLQAENAGRATASLLLHIVQECMKRRLGRTGIDLTYDKVEEELQRERDLIHAVHQKQDEIAISVRDQIGKARSAKERLERDWSNKKQAFELDDWAYRLRPDDFGVSSYKGVVRFPEGMTTMDVWEARVKENLEHAEIERAFSEEMRLKGLALLKTMAGEIRSQSGVVDAKLANRILETERAKQRLEHQLALVLEQIVQTEKKIEGLREALRHDPIESATRLTQSRLHARLFRPSQELTKDETQFQLVNEAKELFACDNAIRNQIEGANQALNQLHNVRIDLEKEIAVKDNTLVIDKERVRVIRSHYPSVETLMGN